MLHFPYTAMLSPYALPRLRFFPEAAIELDFFGLSNLMQDHKEMSGQCLTQLTFRSFTPPKSNVKRNTFPSSCV
jgi:hypothetical protein